VPIVPPEKPYEAAVARLDEFVGRKS
jgi:hypothetical protein